MAYIFDKVRDAYINDEPSCEITEDEYQQLCHEVNQVGDNLILNFTYINMPVIVRNANGDVISGNGE